MQSRHVPPPQSDAGEDVSGRIEAARAPMPPEPAAPLPINPLLVWIIRLGAYLPNLALFGVMIALWEFTSSVWLPRIDPQMAVLMPAPTTIVVTAAAMIMSGELFYHLVASLKREATAFVFASAAIPIGMAMGWWRPIYNQMNPIVELLRPIPPLAWIPLSILWFGIGDQQNEFIIFLGMFFPILINTIDGVKSIEPNLIRAARALGAREHNLLTRIVLRAALPRIVTGIRIGLGVGWMALVAAELVGASSGLGFMINDARSVLRTDIIVVGMLTIGVTGLAIDLGLRFAMRRLMPWSLAMAK
jgi:NitT/TauT family transport system permease protein/taurine transport system permease protein